MAIRDLGARLRSIVTEDVSRTSGTYGGYGGDVAADASALQSDRCLQGDEGIGRGSRPGESGYQLFGPRGVANVEECAGRSQRSGGSSKGTRCHRLDQRSQLRAFAMGDELERVGPHQTFDTYVVVGAHRAAECLQRFSVLLEPVRRQPVQPSPSFGVARAAGCAGSRATARNRYVGTSVSRRTISVLS